MPWLKLALLLAVMIMLPCCACGSSSFLTGSLTKRAHCADIGSLSPHSLKLPFIIGNKKACSSDLNPSLPTTIIQKLPFILSLLWQESSGFSNVFPLLTRVRPVLNGRGKNSPAPEKVFLALTQDEVTDDDRVRLRNEFRELIDKQQQLTKEEENRSSIYIAMINKGLRAVVVPRQVIPELLFNAIRDWLLDAELALYQQILPEADWLDLLPELQAIASVSPESAAADDDGEQDQEPDSDPEPAMFIAGKFGIEPWSGGLYSQAVLQKQKLLGILRQRVHQAIASGNNDLARILPNRIMVIEADLSDLKNAESQVSGNLALQALLLEGLLENSDEVQMYATRNLAVEAPAKSKKRSVSARKNKARQNTPSKKQALSGPDGKPCSSHHGSGSSGDDPGPEQLQHTYNNQPCPICNADICTETKPDSAKELNIVSQGHILALPTEILLDILEYTSLSDRLAMMQCCRRFAEVATNEKLMLDWFHEYIPDTLFLMGKAMSAALEAKTGGIFNNASLVVKRTLAKFYALIPSACTHKLPGKANNIVSLTIFPDDRIVTGNMDHTISVWGIEEGGRVFCTLRLQGHTQPVTSIATLSDCWVISGSLEGTIAVWNLKSPVGQYCASTGKAHADKISVIETLPDMWFYTGSHDKTIKVCRLKKGIAFLGHSLSVSSKVSCLKVLSDGQLFVGTFSGKINFWKTTKADKAPLTKKWRAHYQRIKLIEMLPNGRLLTHSDINEMKIWDLKNHDMTCFTYLHNGSPLFKKITFSKVSPDGQMIVCTNLSDMEIFTFKNSGLDFVSSQQTDDCQVRGIAFLQGGRVVTGSYDGMIRVWDYTDIRHAEQP